MPFSNRIRLPFKITRPQFPEERTSFRKANGVTKTISVTIRKTYEGITDWMPEGWHEKLKIALSHDEVTIEGDKYLGGVTQEGNYEINWLEWQDYPAAPAKFTVNVTPFNATNSNCQTCEEATQVTLVDDEITGIYGGIEEETEYEINVADNDNICCYPAVFSITSFATTFLESAVIDQSGNLTVVTKNNIPVANHIAIVTYRVTCPNGGYDEAQVFADISGSVAACLAPLSVEASDVMATTATMTWEAPDPVPANGYTWELYREDTSGSAAQTGFTAAGVLTADLTGLLAGVTYNFYVHSDCGGDDISNSVTVQFTTATESETCGLYDINWYDGTGDSSHFSYVTYLDCNSEYQTIIVFNNVGRPACCLQSAPGEPVDITGATEVIYAGSC